MAAVVASVASARRAAPRVVRQVLLPVPLPRRRAPRVLAWALARWPVVVRVVPVLQALAHRVVVPVVPVALRPSPPSC